MPPSILRNAILIVILACSAGPAMAAAPGVATPQVPLPDERFGDPYNVTFLWENGTDATWHQVYIEKDGAFWWGKWTKTDNFWETLYPFPSGRYTWWVRSWNSDGYGPWSQPSQFIVGNIIVLEGNKGHMGLDSLYMTWESIIGAPQYDVYISRNGALHSNFLQDAQLIDDGNGKTFEPLILEDLPNGTYDVWVRVPGGKWSQKRTVTIFVLRPYNWVDGTPTQWTEFEWVLPPGATYGKIWLEDSAGNLLLNKWVEGERFSLFPHLDDTMNYRCWVQPWGPSTGTGSWSPVLNFSPAPRSQ